MTTPSELAQSTTRATALNIAARVHQGRGTSPYRVVQDAEVLAEYLHTGDVAEDPALAEAMERFEQAVKDGRGARAYLPDFELTYTPPRAEDNTYWSVWPWRRRQQQREIDEARARASAQKPATPPRGPSGISPSPDGRR